MAVTPEIAVDRIALAPNWWRPERPPQAGGDPLSRPADPARDDPLRRQVGGDHYSKLKIQPIEYAVANRLGPCETLIIRYITRWRDKGGDADLDKVIHTVQLLKHLEKVHG